MLRMPKGVTTGGDNCAVPSDTDPCASSSPDDCAMGDVRALPNDPALIHHHTMIDLVFGLWLQKYSSASYGAPPIPTPSFLAMQQATSCAVPFIPPVFTHSEAFKPADTFGYSYEDPDNIDDTDTATVPTTTPSSPSFVVMVSVPMIVIVLTLSTILA